MRIILHYLHIPLPHEDYFSKNEYSYIKRAYYIICDDFGVNADETWINGNWFYVTKYDNFGDEGKFTDTMDKVLKHLVDLCGRTSI